MRWIGKHILQSSRGQATVEAAFLIPIFFVLLLMLIQPGILLYNHMVMKAAAQEGCRLVATKTDVLGESADRYRDYIHHRLGSIPEQENFHIHDGNCSWNIEIIGSEETDYVSVIITNQLKLLPLFDFGSQLLGLSSETGNFEQVVVAELNTYPSWVTSNDITLSPKDWILAWA